jgi:cytochrome c biogenesis protein CcdA
MLRLIGLVVAIGLADSLNPTTIAPALYLAVGQNARRRVAEFTAAVFLVSLAGGVAITLGPGQLLLSALPHPDRTTRYIAETVAGAAMLVASAMLWRRRHRLKKLEPPVDPGGKSSAILGAMITAVELPTAFPYFAAIAAINSSGLGTPREIFLLVLFNLCFVSPLIAILIVLTVAGDGATAVLTRAREWLQRRWPTLLSGLALIAGMFIIWLGVSGLTGIRGKRPCHPDKQHRHVCPRGKGRHAGVV